MPLKPTTIEQLVKQLELCDNIAIEHGLDIHLEMVGNTLSITKKRKLKMEREWDNAKFGSEEDFFGYRWIGHCYMLEDRNGDMVIGDQLPGNEVEARLLCRVANIAIKKGFAECESFISEAIQSLSRGLKYERWMRIKHAPNNARTEG